MRIRLAPATDIALQIDALGPFYERTDRVQPKSGRVRGTPDAPRPASISSNG